MSVQQEMEPYPLEEELQDITDIHKGELLEDENIKSPDLDKSDFEDLPEKDPDPEIDIDPETDPNVIEIEAEDVDPEEIAKRKGEDFRKKMVSLITPETIIMFADMALSRGGTLVLVKSRKEDWSLDEEEKAVFIEILAAMIEEEGIEFWPAKYWLIIAIVFIYGLKGWDVYGVYYTDDAIEQGKPQQSLEESKKEHSKKMARLEELELEIEYQEKETLLHARKAHLKRARDLGITPDQLTNQIIEEKRVQDQGTYKNGTYYPIDKYPPDKYAYDETGNLKFTNEGKPRKKSGKKSGNVDDNPHPYMKGKVWIHPEKKNFIKKSEFDRVWRELYNEDYDDSKYNPNFNGEQDTITGTDQDPQNEDPEIMDVDFEVM